MCLCVLKMRSYRINSCECKCVCCTLAPFILSWLEYVYSSFSTIDKVKSELVTSKKSYYTHSVHAMYKERRCKTEAESRKKNQSLCVCVEHLNFSNHRIMNEGLMCECKQASDFVYVSQLIWVDPTVRAELFSIHLGAEQLLLEEKFKNFFKWRESACRREKVTFARARTQLYQLTHLASRKADFKPCLWACCCSFCF